MRNPAWRPRLAEARSSRRRPRAVQLLVSCGLAWALAQSCSPRPRDPGFSPPPAIKGGAISPAPPASGRGASAIDLRIDDLPGEPLDLLARSSVDSCPICAEKLRREAFELLEETYRPGRILTTTPTVGLIRAEGPDNELTPETFRGSLPSLTFRFHTSRSRLVGIADHDLTEAAVLEPLTATLDSTAFHGAIQIVGYPYGDGASFLWSASEQVLQVQCKVLPKGQR